MELIIIGVLLLILIPCVVMTVRYYLLRAGFNKIEQQMQVVLDNPDRNFGLKNTCPDRGMDGVLSAFNTYMRITQKERIQYMRREITIRRQIENISHDLRTPLTSVLGYLELMDRKEMSREDQDNLDVVIRKSKALQRLIARFYDLSRLEADEYQMKEEPVDVHQKLSDLMLGSYLDFENRSIDVQMMIGEKPLYALGDADAFERIITNLIHNALKYTQKNLTVTLQTMERTKNEVSSLVEERETVLCLSFENEAGNMTPQNVEQVFDRFYMRDSSRTNQSSGLGLTIAKLLVEKMHGEVFAEVENGLFKIGFLVPLYQ